MCMTSTDDSERTHNCDIYDVDVAYLESMAQPVMNLSHASHGYYKVPTPTETIGDSQVM